MFIRLFAWIQQHERHLSAAAMVAGFVVDNLFFDRIDVLETQLVFLGYTLVCFISIPLLHMLESRGQLPRARFILPLATQFALGGFWSGFLIFYGRSADLAASWPFLLFLVLVFIGNEYFSRYHDRLVFTSILFFFALYSYAIFLVPVYTHTMGTITFLESGVLAVLVFGLFILLLRRVARERFIEETWRIWVGAGAVLVFLNLAYFTNILPPLPLSLHAEGVYHSLERVPGGYRVTSEVNESWPVRYLGFAPTLHLASGESAYAYAEVFAPTALTTTILHEWQWYNPRGKEWTTRAAVRYPITGGRDQGYKGYSTAAAREEGKWRVNVKTADGRLLGRISFKVKRVAEPPLLETITLF